MFRVFAYGPSMTAVDHNVGDIQRNLWITQGQQQILVNICHISLIFSALSACSDF